MGATTTMFGNRTWLKGKQSEDASWPEFFFFFFFNVPVFPSAGFRLAVLSIFIQKKQYFVLLRFSAPQGAAMLVC